VALITGSDCSLDVGGTTYDTVVQSFALNFTTDDLTYQTLSGPRAAGGSETGELEIEFAYDHDEASSLHKALWDGAGTTIAYIATVGGHTYSGNAIAVRPSATANAGEVSSQSVTLPLDGIPTVAAVTP
jgi:hypothetical protein